MTLTVNTYNANMRHAFTLIELMIVVAIIAIIVAIAIPQLEAKRAKATTATVPAWNAELIGAVGMKLNGVYVVTAPDGRSWTILNASGHLAVLSGPTVPAGTALQVEKK